MRHLIHPTGHVLTFPTIVVVTVAVLLCCCCTAPSVTALPAASFEALLAELLDVGAGTKLGGSQAGSDADDYDLHYDQRQSGQENYRVNVDGIMLTVPAASEQTVGSLGAMATNYLLDLAAATAAQEGEDEDEDAYGGGGENVDAVEEEDEQQQHQHQHKYDRIVVLPIEADAKRSEHAAKTTGRLRKPTTLADGLALFVQQSRNNPGHNGPAKKKIK